MTIICALRDPQHKCTWIGSDTQVTTGDQAVDFGPKWIIHKGWAAGCAGDLRTINVIAANAKTLFENLKTPYVFSQRLRTVFQAEGIQAAKSADSEEGGAETFGQDLILVSTRAVWVLDTSLSIYKSPAGRASAEGSGAAYALGAAFSLRTSKQAPDTILRAMIRAAMAFDPNCGGRVWLRRLVTA